MSGTREEWEAIELVRGRSERTFIGQGRPLAESVLSMIDGSAGLGVGLRAYPNETDQGQRRLWLECLRLEASGKIKRADVSTADCVLFVPVEAPC